MLIDQTFLTTLDQKLAEGGEGMHMAPRLTAATNRTQKESSMRPLREWLHARLNQDIPWETAKPQIVLIPAAKQQKYASAIKFIEKSFMNQGSHMFASLRLLSVKLSKSQQRYTIPMVQGNAGHGLCAQMAVWWLKEQLSMVTFRSDFPRMAGENVVKNDAALRVTQAAMRLKAATDFDDLADLAGLAFTRINRNLSFATLATYLSNNPNIRGLLFSFWNGAHLVGIYKENGGAYQFYDANAGSYQIQANNLQAFLLDYNNTCLPLKWSTYNAAATDYFPDVFSVARA